MFSIREIDSTDVEALAVLHAESWRTAYRGILGDEFLDGDLTSNRVELWTRRLADDSGSSGGYIATVDDIPVGFTFAFFKAHEEWGTLLDNLHVRPDMKRQGIGRVLLTALSRRCTQTAGNVGVFLWVYERNVEAQRFYDSIGGTRSERAVVEVRGGGTAAEWRYVWTSPDALLSSLSVKSNALPTTP